MSILTLFVLIDLLALLQERKKMSPAVKLPLPTGQLGVVFKGTPPVVARITDESPMLGKVKVGYVFEALMLSDGTVFEGLTTHELVSTLNEHSEDEGRKLKLKMGMPDTMNIALPEGDIGATIEMVNDMPTITKLSAGSALRKSLRVGMFIDKLTLEDGMVVVGCSADEIKELLNDDTKSSGRQLELKNPKMGMSAKSTTLPKSKTVELPTGVLGTSFKGEKYTIVSSLKEDSPMRGSFRVGMIVDTVKLTDGTEFRGLNAADLSEALQNSCDTDGRQMLLKNPNAMDLPTDSTTKVYLPDMGNAGELGLTFAGTPAAFKEVADTSAIFGIARRGQVILTMGMADGTEYDDLESEELDDILQDTSGGEGRFLVLRNLPMPLPDEKIVTLPTGKIGVVFKGMPPSVITIKPDSPVGDAGIMVGMVVDTLTLESGEVVYEMDTMEFTEKLTADAESEKRVVRFINPTTMDISQPPELEKTDELEVKLPIGKLGVIFKGKSPCLVSSVNKQSPVVRDLPTGMAVDSLTVGKLTYIDMDAMELAGYLGSSGETEGRVLKLKNPEVEGVTFQKLPDSKEVSVPSDKLGVVFKGSPPMAVSYREGSSVEGVFPTGMFVDMITLSDGTIMTGLSTTELVAVLRDSSNETERTMTFKNPKTKEPSSSGIILPEESKIVLPSGSLGVSFKGKSTARAARIHEGSAVGNLIRIGMVVDTIEMPDGKTYAGLTAKEVCRILRDTSDVEGRIMILKNPKIAEMSTRNIMASVEDGPIMAEGDDATDDASEVG